jgi:hypothetical protein
LFPCLQSYSISSYGRKWEINIRLWSGNPKRRGHAGDLVTNDRTILKWSLSIKAGKQNFKEYPVPWSLLVKAVTKVKKNYSFSHI